jgi:hypothetical protein
VNLFGSLWPGPNNSLIAWIQIDGLVQMADVTEVDARHVMACAHVQSTGVGTTHVQHKDMCILARCKGSLQCGSWPAQRAPTPGPSRLTFRPGRCGELHMLAGLGQHP